VSTFQKAPNFYRYSQATLFQFLLSEFLETHGKIFALTHLVNQPAQMDAFKAPLSQLVSSMTDSSSRSFLDRAVFSWHSNNGCLTKLAHFCSLWQSPAKTSDTQTLKKQSYRAFLLCLELQAILNHRREGKKQALENDFRAFQKVTEKLSASLASLTRAVASTLAFFDRDENVVFFLLNRHQAIDAIYGPQFLCNWVKKNHFSLEKAFHFLNARYTKRGFDHILPQIAKKIDELKMV